MPLSPAITFCSLLGLVFTLSTWLHVRSNTWTKREGSEPVLQVLFGDGRQILANHMFVKADVYFHSGYYPSIFDQQRAPTNSQHMTDSEEVGHEEGESKDHAHEAEEAHKKAMDFLTEPKDWIERFGRKFTISSHTHLSGSKERELLPWLKLSAELDPHRVDTYTVAAYWLRRNLGRPKEAEEFLRDGLRANPDSYEILTDLGRLYFENYKDPVRARNLWQAALARWEKREGQKQEPDLLSLDQIVLQLAHLEEEQGNYPEALKWMEFAITKKASPNPEALQQRIRELRAKSDSKTSKQ